MTVLEDRLRAELRAEAGLIAPGSIVPLRLPGGTRPAPGRPRRAAMRRWPDWVKPLAAAAAAAAVIAGTFAIARLLPGPGLTPAGPEHSAVPAYYAYTAPGSLYSYTSHSTQYGASDAGRFLKVRATGTGNLVTTVVPPKPYNEFTIITADASGTLFVLGAMRNWDRGPDTPPRVLARNWTTPMRFLELRIGLGGQPHLSRLALPVALTRAQRPSIALSPAGTRLALAYGGDGKPAVLDVMSLDATQPVRRWVSPPVSWTPLLSTRGAWSGNGRTLVLQQRAVLPSTPARPALQHYPRPVTTTPVRLIDASALGGSLAASRLLVLRPPAGQSAPWPVFLTPDGTRLIGATQVNVVPSPTMESGELSVYSAVTGALLARLAPWIWNNNDPRPGHSGFPREQLAWSSPSGSQLIVLHPRDDLNILGILSGGAFRTTGAALPPRPAGYQQLQYALRTGTDLAW